MHTKPRDLSRMGAHSTTRLRAARMQPDWWKHFTPIDTTLWMCYDGGLPLRAYFGVLSASMVGLGASFYSSGFLRRFSSPATRDGPFFHGKP